MIARWWSSYGLVNASIEGNVLIPSDASSTKDEGTWSFAKNVVLSIVLTTMSRHLYNFLCRVGPEQVANTMQRLFAFCRKGSVAVVDVFSNQPEEFAFDNELLVVSMERYISHVLGLSRKVSLSREGQEWRDGTVEAPVPSTASSSPMVKAEYIYTLRNLPSYGSTNDALNMMRYHYEILVVPADGEFLEIEPGLTVGFQQQVVRTSSLKSGKPVTLGGATKFSRECPPLNFDAVGVDKERPLTTSSEDESESNSNDENGGKIKTDKQENGDFGPRRKGNRNTYLNIKRTLVRRVTLRCSDADGGRERILGFARRAYEWYISTLERATHRYYFYPSSWEFYRRNWCKWLEECLVPWQFLMHRYPLGTGRHTFKSLFFRRKAELIALLDDFKQLCGKFAVPGVPQQLLIVLRGPSGTGKTSIVRAIAGYLGRHLVAVSIKHLLTNSRLQVMLSGCMVSLEGCDVPPGEHMYHLKVGESVYVFEDFDAMALLESPKKTQVPQCLSELALGSATCDIKDGEGLHDSVSSSEAGGNFETTGDADKRTYCTSVSGDSPSERNSNTCGRSRDTPVSVAGVRATVLDREPRDGLDFPFEYAHRYFGKCGDKSVAFTEEIRRCQRRLDRDHISPVGLRRALDPCFAETGRVVLFTTSDMDLLPEGLLGEGSISLSINLSDWDAEMAAEFVRYHFSGSFTQECQEDFEAIFSRCTAGGRTDVMNPSWLEQLVSQCHDAGELLHELARLC